jgi:hypothetical protein
MKATTLAIGLLISTAGRALAQELATAEVAAIERAAAEYIAPTLTGKVIGFDGRTFNKQGVSKDRPGPQTAALLTALKAKPVRTDSAFQCSGGPPTCRLNVDELVRIGEPYPSAEGARVVVELRRRSPSLRQPVARTATELILQKKTGGTWTVVGIGKKNAS